MADIIVLLILFVLIGGAVIYMIKAKKSGVKCIGCPAGGNCPGSARLPKKKLDGPIIGRKKIQIAGMTCENCARNVTIMLNQIDGVCAEVNFVKGTARIAYDREIEEDILRSTVEKMGYQVVSIS